MIISSTFVTHRLRILLICCAAVTGGLTQNAAAARAPTPLAQLVQMTEVVAVVRVLQIKESRSNPGFEIARLEVQNLIKAPTTIQPRAIIKVLFPSLAVPSGSSRFVVAGDDAEFITGERAMVFLKSDDESRYFVTVQGSAGKYSIEGGRIVPDNIKLDDFIERVRELLLDPETSRVDVKAN